jgi:hypothetical protein
LGVVGRLSDRTDRMKVSQPGIVVLSQMDN